MGGNAEKPKVTYTEPQKIFLEKFEKIEKMLGESSFSYSLGKMEIESGFGSFNQSVPERYEREYITLFKFELTPRKTLSKILRREINKEELIGIGQIYLKALKNGEAKISMDVYGEENSESIRKFAESLSTQLDVQVEVKLRKSYGINIASLAGPGLINVPVEEKGAKRD